MDLKAGLGGVGLVLMIWAVRCWLDQKAKQFPTGSEARSWLEPLRAWATILTLLAAVAAVLALFGIKAERFL